MEDFFEERRLYPRIKTNLKVDILKNICGDSIDLSEGGLRFSAQKITFDPTIFLQINFPDSNFKFKADAKLVWEKDLGEDKSLYGVEFFGVSEMQKEELRRKLIEIQISELLKGIKNSQIQKDISTFFLRDMLGYINKIFKLISRISKEKEYFYEIEKELEQLNNEILLKGYCLEKIIENKITIDKVKKIFRSLVSTMAYKSLIVKRAFEKPRGYPGDYLMLETIYNNQPLSKGLGFYFDKYFLSNPYAISVRYRKDRLREILTEEIQKSMSKTSQIFNIACGSCREIRELSYDIFREKIVIFTCVDWDEEALEFSRQMVKGFPENVKFNFIKEDVMNIIKDSKFIDKFNKQDLVYSIGLIDYLPDRILKMFIQSFFRLLKEKGKLILTHKNREKNFSFLPPDWYCDWKFVPRSKEEVVSLFYNCGIKDFLLLTEADKFNDIFYFTVIKQGVN